MQTPNHSKNVVATSGIFEIYHAGHASLLKFAKSFGSHLIVLLNSDESATRIKHKPVVSQELRKLVLESVRWVDQVIIFDEDVPVFNLAEIKPDFYIKGSDYDVQVIEEADVVEFYGGTVLEAPVLLLADGSGASVKMSSSLIKERIKNNGF